MDNSSVVAQPDNSDIANTHKNLLPSVENSLPLETVGTDFDRRMMQRCLELARQATGRTSPNPLVGAVIVKDGEIVGEGFHPRAG